MPRAANPWASLHRRKKVDGKIQPNFYRSPEPLTPNKEQIMNLLCKCMESKFLWKTDEVDLAKKLIKQGLISVKRSFSGRKKNNLYTTTEKGVLYR